MNSKKCKDYSIECIYCDPKLEVHLTTTKETMFKHCRVAHNVEEQIAKKYYWESRTNINDLPNAQIFEKLVWEERLKIEQVCKKWQYVGKNLSWSNERIFDNTPYKYCSESRFMQFEALFERCGCHFRHLMFYSWSPVIILSLIGTAPNVKHLKFRQVKLNHGWYGMKKLSFIAPHLKSLCLDCNHESDIDNGLVECFKVMTCLEYLSISTGGTLFSQYSFVQFPPSLKFLSLERIHINNQILEWIAKGCKDLKTLRLLSCLYGSTNENAFHAIYQMISLMCLHLEINNVDDSSDFGYVFEALTELRVLEIDTVDDRIIIFAILYKNKK
ncbi:hypothetical protein Ddc_17104 [Ditylenchus destructor]|nr:hypothetical protein Ddc_17104 [Ditylenchus destructor]